ncbi:ATG2B protein, partial [Polypterus senegalus]
MPWPFSESIKKRACRYLLHRYLGHFLQEKLSLDQLSLDLYQGTGSLAQVPLDKWSLNEILESVDAPFEVIEGFIQTICLSVPWASLLQENCALEVKGLKMVFRPRPRMASDSEPMCWSSFMASSMQLAKECLSQKLTDEQGEGLQPLEGLEKFAETIETVEYFDETGDECSGVNVHQPTMFAHKTLKLSGFTVFWDEFSEAARTCPKFSSTQPEIEPKLSPSWNPKIICEPHPQFTRTESEAAPFEPVQIGYLSGTVDLSLTLKQNEAYPGAKLDVNGQVDSVNMLMSPRQVHLVLDMLGVFSGSEEEVFFSMAEMDMSHSLSSLPPLGDPPTDDLDLSLNSQYTASPTGSPSGNAATVWDDYLEPPRHRETVVQEPGFLHKETKPHPKLLRQTSSKSNSSDESRPDVVFRLAVSSFSVLVLHIDPLPPPETSLSQNPLPIMAAGFFSCIEKINTSEFTKGNFKNLRPVFDKACPHDHLRFIGTSLKMMYEQRQGPNFRVYNTDMSIGNMELLECLFPTDSLSCAPQYTELVRFDSGHMKESSSTCCLHLNYKFSERRGPQGSQGRLSSMPQKAEFNIELDSVYSELDISIVDRLNSLLQPQKLATTEMMASHMYTSYNKNVSLHKAFTEVFLDDSRSPSNCRVSFLVNMPILNLAVRFPIPDLRSDQERGPWFKKSLQKEILYLEFRDVEFKTEFTVGFSQEQMKLELTFREMIGSFQDNSYYADAIQKFLRVSRGVDGEMTTSDSGKFDWPRIELKVNPMAVHSILERVATGEEETEGHSPEEEEGTAHSLKDVCDFAKPEPSPFSSRRVMYENEEMVIPGDVHEMNEFQDKTISSSRYVLELCLPNVELSLPNKAFYEKLHNRINNDLLLWEPTAPSPVETFENISYGVGLSVASQLINTYSKDSFSQFRSVMPDEDESGSEEETMQYYTTGDPGFRNRRKRKLEPQNKTSQSLLSVLLNVNHGLVTLQTDAKQEDGKRIEGKHGEFWLEIDSGVLFSVSQYEGYEDQQYICLHTNRLCLYHQGLVDDTVPKGEIKMPSKTRPHWLEPTIYRSEEGLISKQNASDPVAVENQNMLSVAIKIHSENLERNLKEYIVSVGTEPRFEMRCSSDVIHIRTCADSCAALMNLIQYIASYGDLAPPSELETNVCHTKRGRLDILSQPPSQPSPLPEAEQQMLQDLMSEAMEDTDIQQMLPSDGPHTNGSHDVLAQTVEPARSDLFLFPDESGTSSREPSPTHIPFHQPMIFTAVPESAPESDDFCILETPLSGVNDRDEEPLVKKLTMDSIEIKENHFCPVDRADSNKVPMRFPVPEIRYLVKEISLIWHLYGGRDFGSGQITSSPAKSHICTPHSSPSQTPVRQGRTSARIGGGRGRKLDVLMEIQLSKVKFQHEVYPESGTDCEFGVGERPVSRQMFIVQDLEIRDRLASSQMNKFLYLYSSKELPRKAHSNMLTVKALHVCPESGRAPQECCLRVSLMPLRLNIDQDALFFLKEFFSSLAAEVELLAPPEQEAKKPPAPDLSCSFPKHGSSSLDPAPIISVPGQSRQSMNGMTLSSSTEHGEADTSSSGASFTDQPVFFRLLGVDKLFAYAIGEWLNDIKKNQLPGILGGVGPIHSLVQLVQGVKDLVWLPIEQYRKDGRIVRGFQRGASSFGTSTAMAALELTNRMVQTIQAAAETAYDMVSPGPDDSELKRIKRLSHYRLTHQPVDLREGVAKAYTVVKEGITDTALTIYDTATREHEQRGVTGAVGGVLRQIPPAVVKPLIVATEATSNVLGGMRNQIRPDARQEESQKWRLGED